MANGTNGTINEKELTLLEKNLQRIFAMNIMKSTFREIQNVILTTADGDKNKANELFESLLVGEIKDGVVPNKSKEVLKSILERFTIPTRLAKDVYERGDFVNIITSDLLNQGNKVVYLNRIRRIDGEEFQFISEPESTIHLLEHFAGRVHDLGKSENAGKFFSEHRAALEGIKEKIDELLKI